MLFGSALWHHTEVVELEVLIPSSHWMCAATDGILTGWNFPVLSISIY